MSTGNVFHNNTHDRSPRESRRTARGHVPDCVCDRRGLAFPPCFREEVERVKTASEGLVVGVEIPVHQECPVKESRVLRVVLCLSAQSAQRQQDALRQAIVAFS